MKKIQFFSLLAGLVLGSLAFVACGDDDDSNDNNGKSDEPTVVINDRIVGTWIWGEPGQPVDEGHHAAGYVFQDNGQCKYYERFYEYIDDNRVLMEEESKEGTFTVTNLKLVMNWTKGTWYDGGSGVRHDLDADELGTDEAEIMYPEKGDIGMFLKRYYIQDGRQGWTEEGPFYKAQ